VRQKTRRPTTSEPRMVETGTTQTGTVLEGEDGDGAGVGLLE